MAAVEALWPMEGPSAVEAVDEAGQHGADVAHWCQGSIMAQILPPFLDFDGFLDPLDLSWS